MRLNWNEGINRLILLIAIAADVYVLIWLHGDAPLLVVVAWLLFFPLVICGCLLLLKAVILWIKSGFSKPPDKEDS